MFACRKQEAITTALFAGKANIKSKLSDSEMRVALEYIKHKISFNYTRRYLEIRDGTIITGISGLRKYDILAKDMLDTNFLVYCIITKKCGVDMQYEENRKLLFNLRLDYSQYKNIYLKMKEIVTLLKSNIHDTLICSGQEIKKL